MNKKIIIVKYNNGDNMKKKMLISSVLIGLGIAGTVLYEKYNKEIMRVMEDSYHAIKDKITDAECDCTVCECKKK